MRAQAQAAAVIGNQTRFMSLRFFKPAQFGFRTTRNGECLACSHPPKLRVQKSSTLAHSALTFELRTSEHLPQTEVPLHFIFHTSPIAAPDSLEGLEIPRAPRFQIVPQPSWRGSVSSFGDTL